MKKQQTSICFYTLTKIIYGQMGLQHLLVSTKSNGSSVQSFQVGAKIEMPTLNTIGGKTPATVERFGNQIPI